MEKTKFHATEETNVLTIKEVSAYLRVHTSTIYRLLKKHGLPGYKIGSDWRFNREDIDKWRMKQSEQPNV